MTSNESDDLPAKPGRKDPREKVMDLLARRAHSELELRQKLQAQFAEDDITDAIDHAREKGWLPKPEDLSAQVAERHKTKGAAYVNQVLESKGLPPLETDSETEIERAHSLLLNKMKSPGPYLTEDLAKALRLLASRGFEPDTIRQALARTGTDVDED